MLFYSGDAAKHLCAVKEPGGENAVGKDGGGGHNWQVPSDKVDKVPADKVDKVDKVPTDKNDKVEKVPADIEESFTFWSDWPACECDLTHCSLWLRREKCNIKAISEEKYAESVCSGPTVNYMSAAVKFRFERSSKYKSLKYDQNTKV